MAPRSTYLDRKYTTVHAVQPIGRLRFHPRLQSLFSPSGDLQGLKGSSFPVRGNAAMEVVGSASPGPFDDRRGGLFVTRGIIGTVYGIRVKSTYS